MRRGFCKRDHFLKFGTFFSASAGNAFCENKILRYVNVICSGIFQTEPLLCVRGKFILAVCGDADI